MYRPLWAAQSISFSEALFAKVPVATGLPQVVPSVLT
jgi:hypothetical protein